jgi:hypothetical protein
VEKCEINYLEPAQNSGGASPDDNDLEIVFVSTRSDLIRRKHREFRGRGASVIGLSGDKIEVQRDFSATECRDKFPVGVDPRAASMACQMTVALKFRPPRHR